MSRKRGKQARTHAMSPNSPLYDVAVHSGPGPYEHSGEQLGAVELYSAMHLAAC